MKRLLLLATVLTLTSITTAFAREQLSVTPIVGLERVQKFQPTPHMKTRGIFGLRAIFQLPVTAIEGEYTHAQDSSNDPVNNVSYKDSEDKIRLGLRGSFDLGSFMTSYLRGGAQARKNEQTRTANGATSTKDTVTKVQPYVGTGLELRIFTFFSLTADLLATFTPTDHPDLKDYELQPSLGINFRF